MKMSGKWIYLENHSMKNLAKMYEWSMDHKLIKIELGKISEKRDKKYYKEDVMKRYIENNHEENSSFCHFGIHRKYNKELIGYIDFQNIENNLNNAELSLSIPDKKYRNKHYGIDAAFVAIMYGIMIRKIRNITIQTRVDNSTVNNICKKLEMNYKVDHFSENGYDIDMLVYKINKENLTEI
jgi:RimJ/RimL family protein N-acetyltransferase